MSVEKSYLGSCDDHEANGSIDTTDGAYSNTSENISEAHCGPCTDLPFLQNSLEGLSLEKYTPENKLRLSNLSLIPNTQHLTAERKVEAVQTPVLTTLVPATSLLKTIVLII